MLGPERLAQSATPLPGAWDDAAFEWLHEVAYGEQPPFDWMREAAERRQIRRRLGVASVATVLGAICEVPLLPAFVEGFGRAAPGAALTMDEVVEFWRTCIRLSANSDSPPEPADWLERIDAMAHDHRCLLYTSPSPRDRS